MDEERIDHEPMSFDNDDYVPFRRGQLKSFKKQLKKYSDDNGLTEEAKREWRRGDAPRRARAKERGK